MSEEFKRVLEEDEPQKPQKGAGIESLRAAWERRKWLAVLAFALPSVAAISVILSLPPLYRSTAVVLVEVQQVPEAFVKATVTGQIEARLEAINQEVLGRSRLNSVIDRFGLYANQRAHMSSEEVLGIMRKDLRFELKTTETRGRPSAFALSYQGRDPQTVALVTNTLASFYVEENTKVRERQAAGTAAFLKARLGETRVRLDDLEERVSGFRKRHMGELPQQMQANLATLEALNTQLRLNSDNQVRAAERSAALQGQMVEATRDPWAMPGSGADGSTMREHPANRLLVLRQQLATASARYTDEHPTIVRLRQEIATLQKEAPEALSQYESTTNGAAKNRPPANPYVLRLRESLQLSEGEVKILKAEEQRLRGAIAAYQARVENTPRREQEFLEMSRDYDTTRELYQSLVKRHEEAQLAESMEQRQKGEQFRIVDTAVPESTPAAPNRLRLLLMSIALSVALAAAAIVTAEKFDTAFHSKAELRAFTTVPVLVSIPLLTSEAERRRARRRFRLAAAGALLGLGLVAGGSYLIAHSNESIVRLLARERA